MDIAKHKKKRKITYTITEKDIDRAIAFVLEEIEEGRSATKWPNDLDKILPELSKALRMLFLKEALKIVDPSRKKLKFCEGYGGETCGMLLAHRNKSGLCEKHYRMRKKDYNRNYQKEYRKL